MLDALALKLVELGHKVTLKSEGFCVITIKEETNTKIPIDVVALTLHNDQIILSNRETYAKFSIYDNDFMLKMDDFLTSLIIIATDIDYPSMQK